jgi:hypothetical protein
MENKKEIQKNLTSILYEANVLDPKTDENILFRKLWQDNDKPLLLIHWLRRFGCPLCRITSLELTQGLMSLSEEIKAKFNLVSIGLSKEDYEDFVKGDYFKNGNIYIDENKITFKALKFNTMGISKGYGMFNPQVYFRANQAKKLGIEGSMKTSNLSDAFQLGGTFIVERNGTVLFNHIQEQYTDVPDINGIYKCLENYKENKREFIFLGVY